MAAATVLGEIASFRTIPCITPTSVLFPVTAFHPHCLPCKKPSSFVGYCIKATPFVSKEKRGVNVIVKAFADNIDSTGPGLDGGAQPQPPAPSSENVPVENLPLESKLQERLEQKLRMKLAKKIRLRRKRLVRKRHLRKKGRWPPSKMKKNKNV